jgi:uncharacterized protein (DUF736 family)
MDKKQYDNNNRGALWKNDRKVKESQPDYTGHCEINSEKRSLSAWIKTPPGEEPYLSVSSSRKPDFGDVWNAKLYKNKEKKEALHPDYTGDSYNENEALRIGIKCWNSRQNDGKFYMRLVFTPPGDALLNKAEEEEVQEEEDDDIPF